MGEKQNDAARVNCKKGKAPPKTENVDFRVTAKDKAELKGLAKKAGMTLSDFAYAKIFDRSESSWFVDKTLVDLLNQIRRSHELIQKLTSFEGTSKSALDTALDKLTEAFGALCVYVDEKS